MSAKFLTVKTLHQFKRMPRCQDIAPEQFLSAAAGRASDSAVVPFLGRVVAKSNFRKASKHFISHRWTSVHHPDPDGRQLRMIIDELPEDAVIWYDYLCLPQKPRNQTEQLEYEAGIRHLPKIIEESWFYVIGDDVEAYGRRAWCQFELLCAVQFGSTFPAAITKSDQVCGNNNITKAALSKGQLARTFSECYDSLPNKYIPANEVEAKARGLPWTDANWGYVGGFWRDVPDLDHLAFAPFKEAFFSLSATEPNDKEMLWQIFRGLFPPREADHTYVKY